MVIQLEIRKIEKVFGKDKWELRSGDIAGSTTMHNITKTTLIRQIRELLKEEENEM